MREERREGKRKEDRREMKNERSEELWIRPPIKVIVGLFVRVIWDRPLDSTTVITLALANSGGRALRLSLLRTIMACLAPKEMGAPGL